MHLSSQALLLVTLAACASSTNARRDKCARVNADVSACLGKGAPLFDCDLASDADLDAVQALATGPACQLAAEAPIDGDVASASCRLYGVDCVRSIQDPPRKTPAQYPILLVNGIDTSPLFRYSTRIVDTLRAQGDEVYLATLTPYEAPSKRAPLLNARIDEVLAQTGARKVNLVCHSLGGLDCRYFASPKGLSADLGMSGDALSSKVASITTVATAHRGTRVADVALGLLPGEDSGIAVNGLTSVLGDWFSSEAIANDAHVRAALQSLTVSEMQSFNDEIVDAPGLYYQSYAGFSRENGVSTPAHDAKIRAGCTPTKPSDGDGLTLFRAHDHMALPLVPLFAIAGSGETDIDATEPNDGLVTLSSATWGTFRGCIPADHMEQLGQYNLPDVNVRTGVDIAWFYAAVASDLAGGGF